MKLREKKMNANYNNKPLISIVMPLYNSSIYVAEAIKSVLEQSFVDWELIVVDDCSTDNSFELVAELAKNDKRIHLFSLEKNGGTAVARNAGISNANGRYLVFLDSDDLLDKAFLEEQLHFIETNNCSVVTCGYRRAAKKSLTTFQPPQTITLKKILNGNPISCLTTMVDLQKTGKRFFDIELRKCEDFYYWISLLKDGYGPVLSNNKVLATYRILDGSKSRKKATLIKWMLRVYKKAGICFIARYYHLFRWMIYGYIKYRNVR